MEFVGNSYKVGYNLFKFYWSLNLAKSSVGQKDESLVGAKEMIFVYHQKKKIKSLKWNVKICLKRIVEPCDWILFIEALINSFKSRQWLARKNWLHPCPDCISLFAIKYLLGQKYLMAQLLHIYLGIVIWMMVAGSVNVKVGVKVVRDKEGLHQISGEQHREGRGDWDGLIW